MAPGGVRALLLSAGRGERLRPLTAELPKPLLPVAGRPLAAWSLDRIVAAGCRAVALNLHHLGDDVRAALGESWRRIPLTYSVETELAGTGGALPPLADFFAGAEMIVLVNGDSLCRWPLDRLLDRHRASGAAVTLLVHRAAPLRDFGGGVAIDRGRVVAFRRGALGWSAAPTRRVFTGAAVLAPELVARLPAGPSDIVTALYEPLLAAGERIAAVETVRAWHDLGTPRRYLDGALAFALHGRAPRENRIARGAQVEPGARVRASNIEAGARIAAGARLDGCLVLAGANVESGARLARVIVGPGVEVAAGTELTERMLTRVAGATPVATPFSG